MNHFDEITCLLYLEGQLDPLRSSELVTHAGECTTCRALLRAIESESHLLTTALIEDSEPIPARLLSEPRWSMPSWVWTLAFGLFAAIAYWAWVDAVSPWLDQLSTAGFGGTDLMSMILFNGAFWEGWSDMMDITLISALIVTVLGALALARRRVRGSVTAAIVVPALLFALVMPRPAAAADVRRGRSVFIPATETVHNDLVVAGPSVRVDGTVEGDLIAFTRDLTVTGHVTGDIIGFAREIRMDGTVDGNVRVFGDMVMLEGSVGKNATAFANTLDLTSTATIGGGMISFARLATLEGKINRDLLGMIGHTDITGSIGGQVWLRGQNVTVASTAEIGGPAIFEGREQPIVAAGAKLASPMQVEITQARRRYRRSAAGRVIHEIFSYGAALLAGILLVTVFPGFFRAALRETKGIGLPIGIGALALITGVFLLILGIILLFAGVGAGIAAALGYAPIFYVSQVFVGAWLGTRILGEASNNTNETIGRIALGLLILHIVGLIPVVGGFTWLVVLLWGTGAVLLGFYRISRLENAIAPA